MLARYILAFIIILLTCVSSFAQVFHYKTGQVIPSNKPDTIFWKDGVFDGYPAKFGTLVAKETHARNAELITIPIIHIPAIKPDSSHNPILILNGGPGETNLRKELLFDSLMVYHDVVLVGYRGVDGSVKLNCPELKEALFQSNLSYANADSLFESAVLVCWDEWEQERINPEGYTISYVVEDIHTVVEHMGFDKVNILSFSFGTMLAHAYERSYADDIDKMILIGARPLGDFSFKEEVFKNQINTATNDTLFYDQVKQLLSENSNSNKILLSNFIYGSMYTYGGILKMRDLVCDYIDGNIKPFEEAFEQFYIMYPSDLVLGDIWLKKQVSAEQNFVAYDSTLISSSLNAWYNILPNKIVESNTYPLHKTSVEKLFMSGAYDIASPATLYKDIKDSSEFIIIPNCGHLDPFIETEIKLFVEEKIMEFFE